MSDGPIRIRGARQHKPQEPGYRPAHRRIDGGDGDQPGQKSSLVFDTRSMLPGSAPLRGDLSRTRASSSTAWTSRRGPHRRRAAGHRHRPDQPGAHLPLHRGHDDRAGRTTPAALRPRRTPALQTASRCGATPGQHPRGDLRAARSGRSAPGGDLPTVPPSPSEGRGR